MTDSFYKAVSSSAVCAVGIINERYKEFRVQLFSDEKNYFAYLQQGPANLRVGVKAEDPSLSDLSELTDIVHVIGNGLNKVAAVLPLSLCRTMMHSSSPPTRSLSQWPISGRLYPE